MPLWSDGVIKTRFLSVPKGTKAVISKEGVWNLPTGTVLVKNFSTRNQNGSVKRLETRIIKKDESGWRFSSYKWNDNQDNAFLLAAEVSENIALWDTKSGTKNEFKWTYPATSCLNCHTGAAGKVLGVKTEQLNKGSQLQGFIDQGLVENNDPHAFSKKYVDYFSHNVNAEKFSRDYLEVNCSVCHRPMGGTPFNMDLQTQTSLDNMNVVNIDSIEFDKDGEALKRVWPKFPLKSTLYTRMLRTDEKECLRSVQKLSMRRPHKRSKNGLRVFNIIGS